LIISEVKFVHENYAEYPLMPDGVAHAILEYWVLHNNPAMHGNGRPRSMINILPGISATCWTNLPSQLGTALHVTICK
jgi:hypothetical protein